MGHSGKIYLVDADPAVRHNLGLYLERSGYIVAGAASAEEFLDHLGHECCAVVVLEQRLEDMSGLELQAELKRRRIDWPVIFHTGCGNIPLSVKAMKAGAQDFLEKPVSEECLLGSVQAAFSRIRELERTRRLRHLAQERSGNLSEREREVMDYLVTGLSNCKIAERLGLSIRTVEVHRANIKKKMSASSLVDLVRMSDLC